MLRQALLLGSVVAALLSNLAPAMADTAPAARTGCLPCAARVSAEPAPAAAAPAREQLWAANAWRPGGRFDVEGLRLLTRMP